MRNAENIISGSMYFFHFLIYFRCFFKFQFDIWFGIHLVYAQKTKKWPKRWLRMKMSDHAFLILAFVQCTKNEKWTIQMPCFLYHQYVSIPEARRNDYFCLVYSRYEALEYMYWHYFWSVSWWSLIQYAYIYIMTKFVNGTSLIWFLLMCYITSLYP